MNKKGQGTVEMILMMSVAMAVTIAVAKYFRDKELLSQMMNGPWTQLTGMIENGTWGPANKVHLSHPNYLRRHISLLGDSE